jgi:hypothetical protein
MTIYLLEISRDLQMLFTAVTYLAKGEVLRHYSVKVGKARICLMSTQRPTVSTSEQELISFLQSAANCSRWFVARGFFYPEDGGIRSSETLVHTRSTRRHIPEHGILHSHRRENLKSYMIKWGFPLFQPVFTSSVKGNKNPVKYTVRDQYRELML